MSEETDRRYNISLLGRYTVQKARAKHKGIEFLLLFDEWCAFWEGHLNERKQGLALMCRINEPGPVLS